MRPEDPAAGEEGAAGSHFRTGGQRCLLADERDFRLVLPALRLRLRLRVDRLRPVPLLRLLPTLSRLRLRLREVILLRLEPLFRSLPTHIRLRLPRRLRLRP